MFLELLLSVINVLVGFVLQVDDLLRGFITFLGSFGFFDHSVDVGIAESTTAADLDALVLSSGFVLGRDVHDAVSVNVECDFNLRVSTRGHWDSLELEVSQLLVVFCELTLSL